MAKGRLEIKCNFLYNLNLVFFYVACIEICNMDPNKPIVLKGKHAREFEKYQKRKDTPEEIAFAKRAEKIYLKHSGPEQKNTK